MSLSTALLSPLLAVQSAQSATLKQNHIKPKSNPPSTPAFEVLQVTQVDPNSGEWIHFDMRVSSNMVVDLIENAQHFKSSIHRWNSKKSQFQFGLTLQTHLKDPVKYTSQNRALDRFKQNTMLMLKVFEDYITPQNISFILRALSHEYLLKNKNVLAAIEGIFNDAQKDKGHSVNLNDKLQNPVLRAHYILDNAINYQDEVAILSQESGVKIAHLMAPSIQEKAQIIAFYRSQMRAQHPALFDINDLYTQEDIEQKRKLYRITAQLAAANLNTLLNSKDTHVLSVSVVNGRPEIRFKNMPLLTNAQGQSTGLLSIKQRNAIYQETEKVLSYLRHMAFPLLFDIKIQRLKEQTGGLIYKTAVDGLTENGIKKPGIVHTIAQELQKEVDVFLSQMSVMIQTQFQQPVIHHYQREQHNKQGKITGFEDKKEERLENQTHIDLIFAAYETHTKDGFGPLATLNVK